MLQKVDKIILIGSPIIILFWLGVSFTMMKVDPDSVSVPVNQKEYKVLKKATKEVKSLKTEMTNFKQEQKQGFDNLGKEIIKFKEKYDGARKTK